ncbi:VOC family protein [Dactylosporangium sp. NPDC005572]|uniref:VOC family protein n=1 Tax=Dactylosporangium sp. NPDC005572 TaxID=3156889 RepID=UPI0033BAC016
MLASADLLVASSQAAMDRLGPILGLYEPRGVWRQVWPRWGFDARWCRVNLDVALAPTHVEIIAPFGEPDSHLSHPFMAEIFRGQANRQYKTHSTPVAIDDMDAMVTRLAAAKARFRVDEPAEELPFPRIWLGRNHDDPGAYDPGADGGLYLEFVPAASFGFPVPTDDHVPRPRDDDHPVVRVTKRTMLVHDIEGTLRALERSTGWSPADPIVRDAGVKRVALTFAHPRSALLEVVQPTDPSTPAGDYLATWGPGPYGISVEVEDLDRTIDRLAALGLTPTVHEGRDSVDIRPDHSQTLGVQLEFQVRPS